MSQPPLAPRTRARWRDLAFLADDLGEALELLGDLLVHADDFVEQAGDLAVDAVDLFGQAHGKSPRRSARSALTSWRRSMNSRGAWMFTATPCGYSPPPVLNQAAPRPPNRPTFNRMNWFTLHKN